MDTVMQLSMIEGHDIKIIGIPKTIDNDLASTDHCPGFGSCAKYISTVISEVAIDSACYDIKNVTIVEIMGRNAGWLTASAALARTNGGAAPHLIYLPEIPFDTDNFIDDVKTLLETTDSVVVAVSEGIRDKSGEYIASAGAEAKEDKFGHKQLGGAGKTLENILKDTLGIKVRSIELNTPQRCAAHIASLTDIEESVMIGKSGVDAALSGQTGKMMIFKRTDGEKYSLTFESEDINKIANVEKKVPSEYINDKGNDVTEEFIKYALPLIQGECNIKYENGLPKVIRR
jgi:6-phosphofructokinase 1